MRLGAPNFPTSRVEKLCTRSKSAFLMSLPIAIAVRAPKYTAVIDPATWMRATPSMTAPVPMM
jgi:hypothetical protein